ncbi:BRD4-interacting chromatin-remodeling complex-associated protein [Periophthalmus magnuspinnatus]|uniref:BRD4-interacting chromatin-remodeling complex-associated protein n=1 Tax=Periophthalmus magnuspinnatus TaxID=409849 RepID=UPI00145BDF59|nr:BRD4-interacting chromatin-remodeling complex-associated protein [Periophthalmus magnuspinnatus]
MEDDDGTCLLDVLCDPQALNDFLHGTNELPTEDLLINSSSGEASLFTDAPSPGSLLGDGVGSPDSPTPGCVDLSFLEEALLSSPEGAEDPPLGPMGTPAELEPKKVPVEEAEEAQVACDILQQSLQEADITEQTMALEAGLVQSGDSLSLYSPAPLLSPVPFVSKSVSLPVAPVLPRDTQAAVDPPQPSLLAVGPGCPSLKPAAPPQLMGLLPGNVFPAASPEISLSPANGSSMIIHKALPTAPPRPIIAQTLRAAAAPPPGIILQRTPLAIQPKLPITIQPRLVQISPKPSTQKPPPGLTFVSGTASPNILLSQPAAQKAAPVSQSAPQLPKPVSLQLVNQAGSFVLQPHGLFHGQNQLLLPGQSPVTLPQHAPTQRQLLTPQGPTLQTVAPSAGQLMDSSQILTVPQRQLNFSPVFTTPTGQLALRQATVLSGPLQLQSAPPTVFQMPAQLTGTYTAGAQGSRATLVHSPAIGNHITLINSTGVLPPDLTSISIVNGPSVVQGLPFAAQTQVPQGTVTEAQLGLQQASVVLLPERAAPEERAQDETFHLTQSYGPVLQQVSVQPTGLQSSTPPVVTILQPPPDPPLAPDPAVDLPKLLMAPAEISQVVEEVTQLSQNQAFMQQLQQQALTSPLSSELLVGALPVVPLEALSSPQDGHKETDQCVDSPLPSDLDDSSLLCSSPSPTDPPPQTFTPPAQETDTTAPPTQSAPPVQYQLQAQNALFTQDQIQPLVSETQNTKCISPPKIQVQTSLLPSLSHAQVQASLPQSQIQPVVQTPEAQSAARTPSPVPALPPVSVPQSGPTAATRAPSGEQPHIHHKPTAALVLESKAFSVPSPAAPIVPGHGSSPHIERTSTQAGLTNQQQDTKLAVVVEQLTPAQRRHRFQQQLCSDHAAVQRPCTRAAFSSLQEAVRGLLPYHTCAGPLPTQDHFNMVDQEFDTVSGFLLKRTKDMVNKYRQLLLREALQDSPSAEMVMLERLFLQAERFTLAEDRRRTRRETESVMTALPSSASSPDETSPSGPSHSSSSDSPPSPPSWTRLSDRPPGLRTYRSSSRGGLRLTIKHESGSRKVVHNSACDPGLKRNYAGQLTNGSSRHSQTPNKALQPVSNGNLSTEDVLPPDFKIKAPIKDNREVSAPKLKCYRLDTSPDHPPPIQEDNMLSEHLQSAIDSILELQRLQGPSTAQSRASSAPSLDQAVASILEGHL